MEKKYAKYMRYGTAVECDNEVYKLIEDMSGEADTVKVIPMSCKERYYLLIAWMQNWKSNSMGFRDRFTGNIEDIEIEKLSYETELKIEDVTPCDIIRFIDSNYREKFKVKNFSIISVNGTQRQVYYIDECHFGFIRGDIYHICQFAEICERNNIVVAQI